MAVNLKDTLPSDSIFHYWLDYLNVIRSPISYDLLVGVGGLGTQLKRGVWFDQQQFKIYPNISLLVVGPSGIGKDTTINAAEREIVRKFKRVPIIGGMSPEMIQEHMIKAGDPACVFLPAKELADFFGSKDYQKDMVKAITSILSNNAEIDLSLKGSQNRFIKNSTMTVFGGSTIEWLHSNMPKDSNEGGFYPRFIVLVEDEGKRNDTAVIPSLPPEDLMRSSQGIKNFEEAAKCVIDRYQNFGSLKFLRSAEQMYSEWCANAHNIFPSIASRYSARSWDHCLRLAMMCTMSRMQEKIAAQDVGFAISVMNRVAERIEEVFEPPTIEYKMIREIFKMLPCSKNSIYKELQKRYKPTEIERVYLHLNGSGQVKSSSARDGMVIKGD